MTHIRLMHAPAQPWRAQKWDWTRYPLPPMQGSAFERLHGEASHKNTALCVRPGLCSTIKQWQALFSVSAGHECTVHKRSRDRVSWHESGPHLGKLRHPVLEQGRQGMSLPARPPITQPALQDTSSGVRVLLALLWGGMAPPLVKQFLSVQHGAWRSLETPKRCESHTPSGGWEITQSPWSKGNSEGNDTTHSASRRHSTTRG